MTGKTDVINRNISPHPTASIVFGLQLTLTDDRNFTRCFVKVMPAWKCTGRQEYSWPYYLFTWRLKDFAPVGEKVVNHSSRGDRDMGTSRKHGTSIQRNTCILKKDYVKPHRENAETKLM
jgi:hypothetical protein